MKKLTILLPSLLISVLFYFASCKKEKVYSNNEDLNNYAKTTITQHQGISRTALAKLGLDTQFAIINSLSPSNNARILKEKIAVLIEDTAVSVQDKEHLQRLYDYVTPAIYENEHPEQDTFLNQWKDEAYNALHWDQRKMEIYLHTWLTESEMNGFRDGGIYLQPAPRDGGGGGEYDCNCDGGYLCETILRKSCLDDGCKRTTWGCGIIWRFPCNGRCSI